MRITENLPPPPPDRTFRLEVTGGELRELLDGMVKLGSTKLRHDMINSIMLALHPG